MKYSILSKVMIVIAMATMFVSCNNEIVIPATTEVVNVAGVDIHMVRITGGDFLMGAQNTDPSADNYCETSSITEAPVMTRTVSDFYIGLTEVTQELWTAVMGYDSSKFSGSNRPVDNISYTEAIQFVTRLNELSKKDFRLPTEIEWEYVARGGNQSSGNLYSGNNTIGKVAWYYDNACRLGVSDVDYGTHDVGTKSANELGIYDMSGNVKEWCSSYFMLYSDSLYTNPFYNEGKYRILRGGAWSSQDDVCRVSSRAYDYPENKYASYGLRLAATTLVNQ